MEFSKTVRIASLAATALLLAAAGLLAQTNTASISGKITDSSGAIVVGAAVTVVHVDTGTHRATVSNDVGYFAVPLLPPGNYSLTVQKEGFRPVTRSGITLHVNQAVRLDFALEVGAVTESITVHAAAPLLQANDSALGAVVDNAKVVNLPLNGRNPFDLVQLTPGTVFYGRPDFPGNNIPLTNFSTNGGPPLTNEVLLDGIPNTVGQFNQLAIVPSIDATEEFKVQTNSFSAEFGRTGGGVVNVSLRSGTNRLHGTVFEFLRNDKFDANNWFNNRAGRPRPPLRFNQFGGAVGGPIAKEKTFFFFNYEGLRRRRGKTFLFTVPGQDMRQGDFSRLQSAAGQPVDIHDPLTTRTTTQGTRVRDPLPGNVVPRFRMDPAALKMLEFWAPPNLRGDPRTGADNFISTAPESYDTNQINVRIDHNIGSAHRLFGRASWNENFVVPPNLFGNIANPSSGPQLFTQRNVGVHDTWTINPTTIATLRLGFTRLRDNGEAFGRGFDIRELGFPANYAAAQTARQFPLINVTGMSVANIGFGTSSLGPVAGSELNNIPNTYTGGTDYTLVRGRHVLKFGGEARVFRFHGQRPSNGGGTFNFTPGFTQGPDPTLAGPTSGNAFASFLLGTAASGSIVFRDTQDYQSYYLGAFLQDDFRLSSRLTLNLGLRYEVEPMLTDRYDRLSFLDFRTVSPIQAPELGRQILGGIGFVGVDGNPRMLRETPKLNLAPRFGFAYSVSSSLVIRGGYGVFFLPRTGRRGDGAIGQEGFSSSTPMISSIDGFTPTRFLRDPFPDGFILPVRNSQRLLTTVGLGVVSLDRTEDPSYMQQWTFGLQQTFPGDVLVEAAYAGSKGTHLSADLQFNQLADEHLRLGNELLRQVANPFFGQIPANTPLGARTVSQAQLLRPFPQFTSFQNTDATFGSSIYHSLQIRAERRFSAGFSVLVSYTAAKLIDDGQPGRFGFLGQIPNYQNHNDRRTERSVSSQEVPQRFVASYLYELPFGPGKRLLGRTGGALARIVAGWQVNGITTFQSGIPLAITTASNPTLGPVGAGTLRPNNNGTSARRSGPTVDRLGEYFTQSVFSQPAPFQFGNTARTLPDARAPGMVNFDFSVIKNTTIREGHTLQLRFEFFNLLNNTNFGPPGTVFSTPAFGVISSASEARIIQLGAKWYF